MCLCLPCGDRTGLMMMMMMRMMRMMRMMMMRMILIIIYHILMVLCTGVYIFRHYSNKLSLQSASALNVLTAQQKLPAWRHTYIQSTGNPLLTIHVSLHGAVSPLVPLQRWQCHNYLAVHPGGKIVSCLKLTCLWPAGCSLQEHGANSYALVSICQATSWILKMMMKLKVWGWCGGWCWK